jgi:hypothetical protein
MDEAILNEARAAAMNEALRRPNSLEALVDKALGSQTAKSLEPAKNKLRTHRKERMRTCQFYLCDLCDKPIHDPDDGFVVHGNVYVADAQCRGGLIGNNFPEVQPGTNIQVTDVKEEVLCTECFVRACGLDKKYRKKEEVPDAMRGPTGMPNGGMMAARPAQNGRRRRVTVDGMLARDNFDPNHFNEATRQRNTMELEPMEETPMESLRRQQAQQQSDHEEVDDSNFLRELEGMQESMDRPANPDNSDDGPMMIASANTRQREESFTEQLSRPPRRR